MEKLPYEDINREVHVIKEAQTNPIYGCKPEARTIEKLIDYGILNLNKPSGPTSHQVADYIKKILNIDKCGHSGTLDPNVTGVLPIALEQATRIVQTLLPAGKEYVCLMHLHKNVPEEEIKKTINDFIGEIQQLPPRKSAIKRQLRTRKIYYFKILEIKDQDVLFRIGCQAGTYVRKICSDFGLKLGTGAHMKQLVRTKVSVFTDKNWHSLQDLKDAYEFWREENNEQELKKIILPFEYAVSHLPKIWVFDSAVSNLAHGSDLYTTGISKLNSFNENQQVAVFTLKNELICLGNAVLNSEDIKKQKKTVAINTKKVFIPRDLYRKEKAL